MIIHYNGEILNYGLNSTFICVVLPLKEQFTRFSSCRLFSEGSTFLLPWPLGPECYTICPLAQFVVSSPGQIWGPESMFHLLEDNKAYSDASLWTSNNTCFIF